MKPSDRGKLHRSVQKGAALGKRILPTKVDYIRAPPSMTRGALQKSGQKDWKSQNTRKTATKQAHLEIAAQTRPGQCNINRHTNMEQRKFRREAL